MSNTQFVDEVRRLMSQEPIDGFDYYQITLLGNSDETITRHVNTCFDGYTETKPQREIRRASFVHPTKMLKVLREIGEPGLLVNHKRDLTIFLLFGGHAVIEKSLAKEFFPELIKPQETAYSHINGRLMVSSLPKQVLQHAPTRKMRMRILKRDGYKCRVCGRTPENDVDIELHVHHIFPWGQGGITEEENLITLCDTCHDGLEPHFDFDLFSRIGIDPISERLRRDKARYLEGLGNYQRIAHRQWEEVKADSVSTGSAA